MSGADNTGVLTECQDKFTISVMLWKWIVVYKSCDINHKSDFLAQSINWWLYFQAAADPGLPTICGSNQGQHGNIRSLNSHELFHLITYLILYMYFPILVYVDLGTGASDTATLNFALSGSYSRYYEIKITQLPCSSEYQYVEFLFFFLQCVTVE